MFEDVASPALAFLLHKLGPHYLGSLQAPQVTATREVLTSQIAEEKITFGLNAVAMTEMTLAKIRKVYSKVDNKSIARQLGMTTHENATPIRVLHNSAGHLLGPARYPPSLLNNNKSIAECGPRGCHKYHYFCCL